MDSEEIEFYKNIGAINSHLESIEESINHLNTTLDASSKKLDAIMARL